MESHLSFSSFCNLSLEPYQTNKQNMATTTASSTATTAVIVPPTGPPRRSSLHQYMLSILSNTLSTLDVSAFAVAANNPQDERQRLVQRCAGEAIEVENLMSLMPAWFKKIHPQTILDEVNLVIDEWLKT